MSSQPQQHNEQENTPNPEPAGSPEERTEEEQKDAKAKLRVMTAKFSAVRKERDALKRENRQLQSDLLELQSSVRAMVPGLQNVSGSFPVLTELINSIDAFYKCDCLDLFFEILAPELPLTEVLLFYKEAFSTLTNSVDIYFQPVEAAITQVSATASVDKCVMNVLRKSYQIHWGAILQRFKKISETQDLHLSLLTRANLDPDSSYEGTMIQRFVDKLSEHLLSLCISDPPMICNFQAIGKTVVFNSIAHDSLDGFIRTGDSCYVVLPAVFKSGGDLAVKACVLSINYQLV
mmetsp:Transcript_19640/g.36183  ORF Transcript_19640/g.36183 Transcript_19640/m.36183 type:complete len:291 (-) Transcript_19640:7273-8145(-)